MKPAAARLSQQGRTEPQKRHQACESWDGHLERVLR